MGKHFNELTPGEQERLVLLMEECAEVVHIGSKILRHGYNSYHPDGDGTTNRELLQKEMGDVRSSMILLCVAGDTDKDVVHGHAVAKCGNVGTYFHHQPRELLERFLAAVKRP